MKRSYSFLLTLAVVTLLSTKTFAQLVGGDNVFLSSMFLQNCVSPNGSLGNTQTIPAAYVTRAGTVFPSADPVTCVAPANGLAEMYNFAHTFPWNCPIATPGNTYGDYTLPGSPWEGWALEIGGVQDEGWYTDLGCGGGYFSTTGVGAITLTLGGSSYQHVNGGCTAPGQEKGIWTGSDAGININMETRLDTNASWVVMTVKLTNTTASAINGVYYMRTCDPDDDEVLSGNFATNNTIFFNQALAGTGNKVLVTSQGQTYSNAYLGLGTKDCRAHCFIAESWPDFSGYNADQYWASVLPCGSGCGGNTYTQGQYDNGDFAIGIVFNCGNLAAGDSTFVCYSYMFDGSGTPPTAPTLGYPLDSAFPNPKLVVDCAPPTGGVYAQNDTINMCTYTGTTATVNILGGDDKLWTWSTWTWAPATGLATTTGISNTINIAALTNPITTYTIIGTTSPKGSTCPVLDTFYVTVLLCNGIVANQPCLGDTLFLTSVGTSTTTSTFSWTGPAGFISTLQDPYIPNPSFLDSGLYTLYVTTAGVIDTYTTHVYIKPLPTVTASSNSPVCAGATDSLKLYATKDSTIETFSWSGPGGFTSVLQDPTREPFVVTDTGWYKVVTTMNGCTDSGETYVFLCSLVTSDTPCIGDTLKFNIAGGTPGDTYVWSGPGGFSSTLIDPAIPNANYSDTGWYTVIKYFGGSPVDTYYVHGGIKPLPSVFASSNAPLCATSVDVLDLYATSVSPTETFAWSGRIGTSALQNPVFTTFTVVDTGWYKVVANLNGCIDSAETYVGVTPVPVFSVTNNGPLCEGSELIITAHDTFTVGTAYTYSGPAGTGATATANILTVTSVPATDSGVYTINLTVGSCPALPVLDTVVVHPTPLAPAVRNVVYCQYATAVPLTATPSPGGTLLWYTTASGGTGSTTAPTPSTTYFGTTVYYVAQMVGVCEGPRAAISVLVNPQPNKPTVTPVHYCFNPNFANPVQTVLPLTASLSPNGIATWYGPLPSTTSAPSVVPSWSDAVDSSFVVLYGVTQTDTLTGCISATTVDTVYVNANPQPPTVTNPTYCQSDFANNNFLAPALTATVTSGNTIMWNTVSNYSTATNVAPVPSTSVTGTESWDVWQFDPTTTCYNVIPATVTVQILYKPHPMITAVNTSVCQYDTMSLAYSDVYGNALIHPYYLWTIPGGDTFYNAGVRVIGDSTQTSVNVRFDSIYQDTIHLMVSDYSGQCATDTSIIIKVIPAPSAQGYIQPNVCLGDTITVALNARSFNALTFTWTVDNQNLFTANSIETITAASSNDGGPYSIYFTESGMHVIKVTPYTVEGCPGIPVYDTITVRNPPTAHLLSVGIPDLSINNNVTTYCLGDSAYFSNIDTTNQLNSYSWTPSNCFNNNNSPTIWGKLENSGYYYVRVTDPWGCVNSDSVLLTPQSCCLVWFPNAFVPDATVNNEVDRKFGPMFYYGSFHTFHQFVITNRWGQVVFQTTENDIKWDGTFNGVPQDVGVYYYYLKYDCNGKTMEEHGDVTLIR